MDIKTRLHVRFSNLFKIRNKPANPIELSLLAKRIYHKFARAGRRR